MLINQPINSFDALLHSAAQFRQFVGAVLGQIGERPPQLVASRENLDFCLLDFRLLAAFGTAQSRQRFVSQPILVRWFFEPPEVDQ